MQNGPPGYGLRQEISGLAVGVDKVGHRSLTILNYR